MMRGNVSALLPSVAKVAAFLLAQLLHDDPAPILHKVYPTLKGLLPSKASCNQ